MPIHHLIDHADRIVTTDCSGRMTDEDIQVDQRIFWAQDWTAGYGELFDMRGADFSGIAGTRSRYAGIVASDEAAALVPVALLCDPDDDGQRSVADRYVEGRRAMSAESTCRAFDDSAAAMAWLRTQLAGHNGEDVDHGGAPAAGPTAEDLRAAILRAETTEQAMRASVAATRSILNSTHDAVFGCDAEGEILFANHRCHEITGSPDGSLVGRAAHDAIHRLFIDVADRDTCAHCAALGAFEPQRAYDLVIERPSGPSLEVDLRSFAVNHGGVEPSTIVTFTDVTDRRTAERRYASLVSTVPVGIFTTDLDGILTYANARLFDLIGRSADEAIGRSLPELVDSSAVRTSIAEGWPFAVELRIGRADGTAVWVLCTGDTDRDGAGRTVGINGVLADITELKAAEAELTKMTQVLEARVAARTEELSRSNAELEESLAQLQRTQEALVEGERMAALGQVVAGLAHEINTPIGVSRGAATHLETLLDEYLAIDREPDADPARRARLRESIEEAVDLVVGNLARAADLIRRLKQASIDRADPLVRPFGLLDNIDATLANLSRRLAAAGVSVEVSCDPMLEVVGDPGLFSQMHTIAVDNALTHAFEGRDTGCRIDIDVTECDGAIAIVYRDNGVGVGAAERSHLFEPFYTTRRHAGGTGLGLHILYRLVTGLGGSVTADAGVDGGFVLSVEVPTVSPGD